MQLTHRAPNLHCCDSTANKHPAGSLSCEVSVPEVMWMCTPWVSARPCKEAAQRQM